MAIVKTRHYSCKVTETNDEGAILYMSEGISTSSGGVYIYISSVVIPMAQGIHTRRNIAAYIEFIVYNMCVVIVCCVAWKAGEIECIKTTMRGQGWVEAKEYQGS